MECKTEGVPPGGEEEGDTGCKACEFDHSGAGEGRLGAHCEREAEGELDERIDHIEVCSNSRRVVVPLSG